MSSSELAAELKEYFVLSEMDKTAETFSNECKTLGIESKLSGEKKSQLNSTKSNSKVEPRLIKRFVESRSEKRQLKTRLRRFEDRLSTYEKKLIERDSYIQKLVDECQKTLQFSLSVIDGLESISQNCKFQEDSDDDTRWAYDVRDYRPNAKDINPKLFSIFKNRTRESLFLDMEMSKRRQKQIKEYNGVTKEGRNFSSGYSGTFTEKKKSTGSVEIQNAINQSGSPTDYTDSSRQNNIQKKYDASPKRSSRKMSENRKFNAIPCDNKNHSIQFNSHVNNTNGSEDNIHDEYIVDNTVLPGTCMDSDAVECKTPQKTTILKIDDDSVITYDPDDNKTKKRIKCKSPFTKPNSLSNSEISIYGKSQAIVNRFETFVVPFTSTQDNSATRNKTVQQGKHKKSCTKDSSSMLFKKTTEKTVFSNTESHSIENSASEFLEDYDESHTDMGNSFLKKHTESFTTSTLKPISTKDESNNAINKPTQPCKSSKERTLKSQKHRNRDCLSSNRDSSVNSEIFVNTTGLNKFPFDLTRRFDVASSSSSIQPAVTSTTLSSQVSSPIKSNKLKSKRKKSTSPKKSFNQQSSTTTSPSRKIQQKQISARSEEHHSHKDISNNKKDQRVWKEFWGPNSCKNVPTIGSNFNLDSYKVKNFDKSNKVTVAKPKTIKTSWKETVKKFSDKDTIGKEDHPKKGKMETTSMAIEKCKVTNSKCVSQSKEPFSGKQGKSQHIGKEMVISNPKTKKTAVKYESNDSKQQQLASNKLKVRTNRVPSPKKPQKDKGNISNACQSNKSNETETKKPVKNQQSSKSHKTKILKNLQELSSLPNNDNEGISPNTSSPDVGTMRDNDDDIPQPVTLSVDQKATKLARKILGEPSKVLTKLSEITEPNFKKIKEQGLPLEEYELAFAYRPKVPRTPSTP